ncbi:hypothetical protein HK100_003089 [Physocladia obscura]|uniref:Uncharacterized protein n=1 Tax=Physocladia obscura TaxID=109957 RepID=A0AAD5TCU6_9FUNG|nr:hypothetical protein HK100_003089 [Physocladia obscura]
MDQTNLEAMPISVPVTTNSSAMITSCRPLPDDIATMSDGDTGCQYCGVSYLLLSKYNRIVKHVSTLEQQLETLKAFAIDYPILLAKHSELEIAHTEISAHAQELAQEAAHAKEEAGRAIRGHHELQLRYTRLTYDFECMSQRGQWMDDSLKGQIKFLAKSLCYTREEISLIKQRLSVLRNEFQTTLIESLESLKSTTSQWIYAKVSDFVASAVAANSRVLTTRNLDTTNSLMTEIEGLKEDLTESDKRYNQLLEEIKNTTDQYEEYLNLNKESHDQLSKELELENSATKQLEQHYSILQTEKTNDENRQELERQDHEKTINALKAVILEYETKISTLQKSFAQERAAIDAGGDSVVEKVNNALAQKDLEIYKLHNKTSELTQTITQMRDERIKTIEAHQSRVKQLQDKYMGMLKESENIQKNDIMQQIQEKFEAEKIVLLKTQKSNFQKQIADIQLTLHSQIDAARLSRDQTAVEAKKKISAFELELTKVRAENEKLKIRILSLETQTPVEPSKLLAANEISRLKELESEITKKSAEIGFLKETVKMECEERMQLLASLDTIQRGVNFNKPNSTTSSSTVDNQSKSTAKNIKSAKKEGFSEETVSTTQYQKLMAMAKD